MAMKYDDALKVWGVQKLHSNYPDVEFDLTSVRVEHEYNATFGCETCGYEIESEISVIGRSSTGKLYVYTFDWTLSLATFIKEVVIAGGGTLVE